MHKVAIVLAATSMMFVGVRTAHAQESGTSSGEPAPAESSPRAEASAPAKTGWAGVGAGIGLGLAGAGLVGAIASDAIQSNGGDSRALGGVTVATFVVGGTIVAIARGSTSGRGSPGMRIGGYVSYAVALGIGAYLLGHSISTGDRYPAGIITGLGVAGATGLTLMSVEALKARSQANEQMTSGSLRLVPTVAVVPKTAASPGGATLGVVGVF